MQTETYDVIKRETFKCPLNGQFLDVKLVQVIIIILNHKSSYFLMICANNHTKYIWRAQICIQIYMKTPQLRLTYQYLQIKKDCISFYRHSGLRLLLSLLSQERHLQQDVTLILSYSIRHILRHSLVTKYYYKAQF